MRRILALIALLALVVGPPVALVTWGFTDWGAVHLWSTTDVRVLLAVLTALAWLAWAAWMVALAAEVAVALSGRRVRLPTPGLSLPRAMASALVAAILAAGATSAHAAPLVGEQLAPVVAPVDEVNPPEVPGARTDGVRTGPTHTVVPGDDLWSLAERYYSEGGRWRTIVEANPHLQADPVQRLVPGTVLSVPDPVTLVTVRPGDTLRAIAAAHLGDPDRWPEVKALNSHRIADPDLIHPGWVLTVPLIIQDAAVWSAAPPSAPAAAPTPAASPAGDDGTGRDATALPHTGPAATTNPVPAPDGQRLAPASEAAPAAGLLGGMTALSAAAVLGGVGLRRRLQEHHRPLGRRYAQPGAGLARYETALAQVAAPQADRVVLLGRAMRLLARHWWEERRPAAPLVQARIGPDDLTFVLESEAPSAPEGFTRIGATLSISWGSLAGRPDVDHPVAYPALVTLGESEPGCLVMVDALASGVLGVRDDGGTGASEVLSAMLVELACSPWSEELGLLVVTRDPRFAEVASEGRVACEDEAEGGVAAVERLVRQRTRLLDDRGWDEMRLDPDLTEAWAAQVVLFEEAPDAGQLSRLEGAVGRRGSGVSVIAPVPAEAGSSVDWVLTRRDGISRLADGEQDVVAQTVPADTRQALADLYDVANDPTTGPAPWWHHPREEDVNIIALRPLPSPLREPARGPRLNLLGPVELEGCAGPPPPRAIRQCIEYCAWIHLNPGSSPVQMVNALVVAEGTRRSNMSRLRSWLGTRPDGELYLPDA